MWNPMDPMGSLVDWMTDAAVEGWRKSVSWTLGAGGLGDAQWAVAGGTLNRIAGVMAFVAVGVGAVGVVRSMFSRSVGDTILAAGKTVLAWPLTAATATVVVRAVSLSDKLTSKVLGSDGIDLPNLDSGAPTAAFGTGMILFIDLVIVLGSVVMLIMVAVRTFLLILGVSFLPAVAMLLGWKALSGAWRRWGSWMTGVILMQPVMAVIVFLCSQLMKAAGTDNPMSFLVAAVGVILSSVFPWTLVKVVGEFLPAGRSMSMAAMKGQAAVAKTGEVAGTVAKAGMAVASGGMSMAAMGAGAKAAGGAASAGDMTGALGEGMGGRLGGMLRSAGRLMDAKGQDGDKTDTSRTGGSDASRPRTGTGSSAMPKASSQSSSQTSSASNVPSSGSKTSTTSHGGSGNGSGGRMVDGIRIPSPASASASPAAPSAPAQAPAASGGASVPASRPAPVSPAPSGNGGDKAQSVDVKIHVERDDK